MGLLDKLFQAIGITDATPESEEVRLEGLAIEISPPTDVHLARLAGRLRNLMSVEEADEDVLKSIKAYQAAIEEKGRIAPTNLDEADALILSLPA